jgi:hypothetical protein
VIVITPEAELTVVPPEPVILIELLTDVFLMRFKHTLPLVAVAFDVDVEPPRTNAYGVSVIV